MTDMKEFLEKKSELLWSQKNGNDAQYNCLDIKDLGSFFWERGGKQFVKTYIGYSFNEYVEEAEWLLTLNKIYKGREQIFLYCVACLGETKVKELISELKEEQNNSNEKQLGAIKELEKALVLSKALNDKNIESYLKNRIIELKEGASIK